MSRSLLVISNEISEVEAELELLKGYEDQYPEHYRFLQQRYDELVEEYRQVEAAGDDDDLMCTVPYEDVNQSIEPAPLCGAGDHVYLDVVESDCVARVVWRATEAWCSEQVKCEVECGELNQSLPVTLEFQNASTGFVYKAVEYSAETQLHEETFDVLDILPQKEGDKYLDKVNINASANSVVSETPLAVKQIINLPKSDYSQQRTHFSLEVKELNVMISRGISFVKGWGGKVVKLGNSVPATTGGLLDSTFGYKGYRWMKNDTFWDGTAWQPLPTGFVMDDSVNFDVGFYKTGSTFTSQYGGTWPESFVDYDLKAPARQNKIRDWANNIGSTWSGAFYLRRKACQSSDPACCRFSTSAAAAFTEQTVFAAGMLIIADGNGRSNDSLFYLGETRLAVAAHEFGHHLGNPDEYAGAAVDTGLNTDGATNGIDPDSIMGQNLTKVKARHYRTICKHLSTMVKTAYGITAEYTAVKG